MALDRPHRDVQLAGDLAVAQPLTDELEHLVLAFGDHRVDATRLHTLQSGDASRSALHEFGHAIAPPNHLRGRSVDTTDDAACRREERRSVTTTTPSENP